MVLEWWLIYDLVVLWIINEFMMHCIVNVIDCLDVNAINCLADCLHDCIGKNINIF